MLPPSRYKTLLNFSALSILVAALSGCGEDAKDCGGFWDNTFGREACAVQSFSPHVTGVSPIQATVGITTTFTLAGENLTDAVQVALPECESLTVTSRSATQIAFSCKPLSISSQKLVASNGSTELISTNVNFTVDKSDPTILKGVFVDSLVGGLDFATDSIKGITDEKGTFYYRSGEKVNFKVGNQEIGQSIGQSNIHVYDMNNDLADIKYEKARKIAQLLQSLDSDGNSLNNITIDPAVREHFLKEDNLISYYVTDTVYEQALADQLKSLKKPIVPSQQAQQHLDATFANLDRPLHEYPEFTADVDSGFPSINNGKLLETRPNVNLQQTIGSDYFATQYYYIYKAKVRPLISSEIKRAFEGVDIGVNDGSQKGLNESEFRSIAKSAFSTTVDTVDGLANLGELGGTADPKVAMGLFLKAASLITIPVLSFLDSHQVIFDGKDDAYSKKMDTAKVIVDAIGKNAVCILDSESNKAIDRCVDAITKSIELLGHTNLYKGITDNKEAFRDTLKDVATVLKDAVKTKSGSPYAIAKLAGSTLEMGVNVAARSAETEGQKFIYDSLVKGALIPILKVGDCVTLQNANIADQFADCMNNVIFPAIFDQSIKIVLRFNATIAIQKNLQKVYEYDVANMMLQDVFIYNGIYNSTRFLTVKWGYDDPSKSGMLSDEAFQKKVIKILLTDKQKSKGIWTRSFDAVTFSPSNTDDAVDNVYRIYKNYLNEVIFQSKDYSSKAFQISLGLLDNPNGLAINATVNFNYNLSDVDGGFLKCFIDDQAESLQTQNFEIRPTNLKRNIPFVLTPSKAGIYDVVCDAFSKNGFLGRVRESVAVSDVAYSIQWEKDKTVVRVGEPVAFDVTGNGKTMLVKWQFGDGATTYLASPTENISYTFTSSGKQSITATAIDVFGRTFEYKADVDVIAGTVSSNKVNPIVKEDVSFSVETAINYIKSVIWKVGGVIVQTFSSIADTFQHAFEATGDFVISATLRGTNEAEIATVSTTVSVKPLICPNGQIEQGGKCVVASISQVTPLKAISDQKTAFTLTGANLSGGVTVILADCADLQKTSTTVTQIKFECTPKVTGDRALQVKDQAGNVLWNANITFEYIPIQPAQPTVGFSYITDPLAFMNQTMRYDFSYWVSNDPVQLGSYSVESASDVNKFAITTYATSGVSSNIWRSNPYTSLVFSLAQQQWIESNNNKQAAEGIVGTSGVKTVYITDDLGVQYYTLLERDLSDKTIAEGLTSGFGDGRQLPTAVYTATFSNGAKAYTWIRDVLTPTYSVEITHYVFSSRYDLKPVYTCVNIGSCSSTATSLNNAITQQAWIRNGGNSGSVRLKAGNQAELLVTDPVTRINSMYIINYQLVSATTNGPARIVFSTVEAIAKQALANYFGINDEQMALYEYNGQVVRGTYTAPIKGQVSQSYQYNKAAINDILTKWSPAKAVVLE